MFVQAAILGGGLLCAGISTYRQFRRPKNLAEALSLQTLNPQSPGSGAMPGFMAKADQACQQLIQQKIDPLFSGGATRRQQLAALVEDDSTLPLLNETEKTTNRYLALSGLSIGLSTLASFVFPALLVPAMLLGAVLLFPMYQALFKDMLVERKLKLSLLGSLYLSGFWLAGYYVFAGVAFFLYFLGLKIVHQMEGRSRQNLTDLFALQPRFVWRLVDGSELETAFEALQAGDVVVVNAGEPIPVDGLIVGGMGSVDQHMLTGESQPLEKEPGDRVFTSTLLLSGRLLVQVETTGASTVSAQIVEVLNKTANYHSETELKGMALANQSILPNLAISAIALPLVGLRGAVASLGASVGFNINMVSLLATMNYLSIASRHGILIKDGRVLDRLKAVDTVVFDKTGTLTLEQPHIARIHVFAPDLTEDGLLAYAATAEHRQPHPIALAIVAAAKQRGLPLMSIAEASYEVGYGIKVKIGGRLVRVGSSRFMAQEGLSIPDGLEALQLACQTQGFALVGVAIDGQLAGAIELHATLRPEAKAVIEGLKQRGLSLSIISGDQAEPTRKLAGELGIDTYFADTLPENKAKIIRQLQEQGRVVCFIGDGINDAIALKQADVSISLKGATTIATDTAQVVLMDKSLNQLDTLFSLARQYDKTMTLGLWTTVIPGVVCIGGVFFAGFGIYAAEILFQLGFFSGLGVAMRPLLMADNSSAEINKENALK